MQRPTRRPRVPRDAPRIVLLLCPAFAVTSWAQEQSLEEAPPPPEPPRPTVLFSLDAGAEYNAATDLKDAAGEYSVSRARTRIGATFPAGDRARFTLGIGSEFSLYDFDDSNLFRGGADPLDGTYEFELSGTLTTSLDERWGLVTGVSGNWAGESGADFGDSFTIGGLALATYQMNPRLNIGGGVLGRTGLEDDGVIIPIAVVDWAISDRLRLGNSGNQGGARATLAYALSDAWTLTLDGGYERREFRLADDHPIPEGVARETSIPVALGAVFRPHQRFNIGVRTGVNLATELEFEDDDGRDVVDTDVDPSLFVALEMSIRF